MAKGLVAADLRNSTEEELDSKLAEAKTELFNLRFQAATGQLESHGRLRAVRKEIARIYTVKRERELGIVTIAEETKTMMVQERGARPPTAATARSAGYVFPTRWTRPSWSWSRTPKYGRSSPHQVQGAAARTPAAWRPRPARGTRPIGDKRWRVAEIWKAKWDTAVPPGHGNPEGPASPRSRRRQG
jgi:large subunit ribosomal protein L29